MSVILPMGVRLLQFLLLFFVFMFDILSVKFSISRSLPGRKRKAI